MKNLYFLFFLMSSFVFAQNPGDIVITEIMQNPSAVSDTNGEYVEVYNSTGSPIDLNGWILSDAGTDTHTITGSVVVAPGGYAVLGRDANPGTNGGVTVDYQYATFFLSNSGDEVILTAPSTTIIDQVFYDGGPAFPDPSGASMNLDPTTLNHVDNDTGTNWCVSTSAYGAGDLGTPGSANDACGPTCQLNLQGDTATCDMITGGVDPYTATLDFSGGGTSTYVITTNPVVTVTGDDPTTMASGTITFSGIDEGTDLMITIDDLGVGGVCNLMRTINSPACIPATCSNPGDIIITEIMQNPSAVFDSDGEYFEVYNTTAGAIDMAGWVISDVSNPAENFTVASSVVVPAGGYAVFGVNANSGTNGGVTVDYEYDGSSFFLGNGSDELSIECTSTIIDQVSWDNGATFPDPNGASMELAINTYDSVSNDAGTNWGVAVSALSGGDFGTPGADNDYILSVESFDNLAFSMYPNPNTDGILYINTNRNESMKVEVFDVLGKRVISTEVGNAQLDVSNLRNGLYMIRLSIDNATITKKLVIQ